MKKEQIEKIKELYEEYKKNNDGTLDDYDMLMNSIAQEGVLEFDTVMAGNDGDAYLYTSYYSPKLKLNIELDIDSYQEFDTFEDLLDMINAYHKQIKEVEAKIK
jgi:hypothetical protein